MKTPNAQYQWMGYQLRHLGSKLEWDKVPILFCIAIDFMRSHTAISSGLAWNGKDNKLGDLDFADDICLINSTYEEMQEKTTVLNQQAAKIGLLIHKRRTETLRNLTFNNNNPVKLDNDELNEVDKFTCLGSIVTANRDCLADIKNRTSKTASAMNKLNNFWKNKNIEQKTKLQIFRTNLLPVLLYGSETWSMSMGSERRLASFHLRCLCRLLHIKWYEFKINTEVLEKANTESIATTVKRRRWKYLGHALRTETTRMPKQAWEWKPHGTRKRGRPRLKMIRKWATLQMAIS